MPGIRSRLTALMDINCSCLEYYRLRILRPTAQAIWSAWLGAAASSMAAL
jgi:hypothetical protein